MKTIKFCFILILGSLGLFAQDNCFIYNISNSDKSYFCCIVIDGKTAIRCYDIGLLLGNSVLKTAILVNDKNNQEQSVSYRVSGNELSGIHIRNSIKDNAILDSVIYMPANTECVDNIRFEVLNNNIQEINGYKCNEGQVVCSNSVFYKVWYCPDIKCNWGGEDWQKLIPGIVVKAERNDGQIILLQESVRYDGGVYKDLEKDKSVLEYVEKIFHNLKY